MVARPNTYGRWERALARAVAEDIRVLADDGRRSLVLGSDGRMVYIATDRDCTCPAWTDAQDPICKHRAARHLSRTAGGDDTPPAAPSVCPVCKGHGEVRKASATFAGVTYRIGCPACTPAA